MAHWLHPFDPIEHTEDAMNLVAELQREVKRGHPLFGLAVKAVGWRCDCDEVLFQVFDGSERIAEVHLTWAGERERPPWPVTKLFDSFGAWVESRNATKGNGEDDFGPTSSLL